MIGLLFFLALAVFVLIAVAGYWALSGAHWFVRIIWMAPFIGVPLWHTQGYRLSASYAELENLCDSQAGSYVSEPVPTNVPYSRFCGEDARRLFHYGRYDAVDCGERVYSSKVTRLDYLGQNVDGCVVDANGDVGSKGCFSTTPIDEEDFPGTTPYSLSCGKDARRLFHHGSFDSVICGNLSTGPLARMQHLDRNDPNCSVDANGETQSDACFSTTLIDGKALPSNVPYIRSCGKDARRLFHHGSFDSVVCGPPTRKGVFTRIIYLGKNDPSCVVDASGAAQSEGCFLTTTVDEVATPYELETVTELVSEDLFFPGKLLSHRRQYVDSTGAVLGYRQTYWFDKGSSFSSSMTGIPNREGCTQKGFDYSLIPRIFPSLDSTSNTSNKPQPSAAGTN